MNRGGSVISFLTADILQEDKDFKQVAVLCGRDAEIKAIREAYKRGAKGQSEVFLVHGVPGTGKSTLMESMRAMATSNDGVSSSQANLTSLPRGRNPSLLSQQLSLIYAT
jgi:Cdc6-like AAA superfamily ATPase